MANIVRSGGVFWKTLVWEQALPLLESRFTGHWLQCQIRSCRNGRIWYF
nr:MAG TPA: hypothetical protein [Caudoviricetes sp.]